MSFPVTLNGTTYTLADFSGTSYVDGFPAALEDFVTHAGAIYSTTSTTSNVIGTGSKTFTVEASKPYQVGTPLRIADTAAVTTNWIDAIVTSYSGTSLVVTAVAFAGSGTKTAWSINIGGGPIAYTGTLPIAQGGTGATSATAAASNLGVGTEDSPTFSDATLLTSDGGVLNLQTSEATIVDGDVLGALKFNAPSEGDGADGDARLVGAAIEAVAEGTFSDTSNATELLFKTGASAAAATKMTLSSAGDLTLTSTTASTSSTTGSLIVGGGVGIAADLFVGDDFDVTGDAVIDGTALVTGVLTTTAATIFNGGFAANAASTISTADNLTGLTVASTDADAGVGPTIQLFRNSSSPADNDLAGNLLFVAENDASEATVYANLGAHLQDVTNGTEDGKFFINTMVGGAEKSRMFMPSTETVFNEESIDLDFRVETDNATHALFVQGSDGNVGIGVTAPTAPLTVKANGSALAIRVVGRSDDISEMDFFEADDSTLISRLQARATFFSIGTIANIPFVFRTNNTDRVTIAANGDLLVGTTTAIGKITSNNTGGTAYGAKINASGSGMEVTSGGLSNSMTALVFKTNHGTVGSITCSNATSYNTSSDYRLKTDAKPMTGASARVLALKPVNFEWLSDGSRVDGFIAHEAQAIVPECVTGTKDAMRDEEYQVSAATGDIYTAGSDEADEVIHSKNVEQPEKLADGQQWRETTAAVLGTRSVPDMQGLDQSKLVPLLVASLQEALARITALENA